MGKTACPLAVDLWMTEMQRMPRNLMWRCNGFRWSVEGRRLWHESERGTAISLHLLVLLLTLEIAYKFADVLSVQELVVSDSADETPNCTLNMHSYLTGLPALRQSAQIGLGRGDLW